MNGPHQPELGKTTLVAKPESPRLAAVAMGNKADLEPL